MYVLNEVARVAIALILIIFLLLLLFEKKTDHPVTFRLSRIAVAHEFRLVIFICMRPGYDCIYI